MALQNISIFGGSQSGNKPDYTDSVERLATVLAKNNIGAFCGGNDTGLVRTFSDKMREQGAKLTRVLTINEANQDTNSQGRTIVKDIHEQQASLNNGGDAYIAVPGSGMTYSEIFSALTETFKTGQKKVIGLLNIDGYFDPLLALFKNTFVKGFSKTEMPPNIIVDTDPEILVKRLSKINAT